MDLQGIFSQAITDKVTKEIATKIGIDESTAGAALGTVLPKLLGQLGKNAQTEEWSEAIDTALDKWHNTPDLKLDMADGAKILGHLFGNSSQKSLEQQVAQNSGLDEAKSSDLLKLASSFMMENLGKAKNEGNLKKEDMGGMLSLATTFLDKDGDGDIKDDLLGMGLNMLKNKFFGK